MATVATMSHSTGSVTPSNSSYKPQRSTLVRKREVDSDTAPSSPSKRSRVTFDTDVEVRTVAEFEKAPALIQEEVHTAFQRKANDQTDRKGYDQIKAVYNGDDDDDDERTSTALRHYTASLLSNSSSLNKANGDLVQAIINSEWLGRDDDYVEMFLKLLANIVNRNASFLGLVLNMLVENLQSTPASSGRLAGEPAVSKSSIYTRAHKALQYLTRVIPSTSSALRSILSDAFPHYTDSVRAHVVFTKNLLRVLDYAPELRKDILALITERLVNIDVQVQVDIEDLEEDMDDSLVLGLPRPHTDTLDELVEDSESSDDESDEDGDENAEAQRTRDIKRNVDKMDSMLDILFSYYDRSCSSLKGGTGLSPVIDDLMGQFEMVILLSHRSRHTQFLLFHFVQQSTSDIDNFVGLCVSKILGKGQSKSTLERQDAAAYLGSFVARGMKVPSEIVRLVFDYISDQLDQLRRKHEPTCRGPHLRQYPVYYCLVQALMYMFCFRWRDLELRPEGGGGEEEEAEDDDLDVSYTQGHQWKVGVKETFAAHIFSKLNPLKVCSPAIVNEFARVAHHLGVVYVYHLLETNKRIQLSRQGLGTAKGWQYGQMDRETALSVSQDESHYHLDAYFPFDPYHLPRSKRWIAGDYREWTPIPGLDDADTEDSENAMDENDSEFEEGTETDMTNTSH